MKTTLTLAGLSCLGAGWFDAAGWCLCTVAVLAGFELGMAIARGVYVIATGKD